MLDLESAIKHCEEVAEKNENEANFGFGNVCIDRSSCLKCADEHRQLATWLRELKAYRAKSQENDNEQIIKVSKGAVKARTGKYVVYDVEWLKEHFNTTEAKLYGQPSEDCISRKAVLDSLHSCFAEGFNEDRWWNSTYVLDIINKAPSVTPQPKVEGARGDIPLQQSVPEMPQPKTGHWFLSGGYWRCSECKEKALLKLDKATGGYREYEPVRSKYCPECGAKMQEEKK